MSTDHDADYDMDVRLHEAGERWREANDAVAKVDLGAATTTRPGSAEPTEVQPTEVQPTEVPLVPEAPKASRRRARVWISAVAGLAAAVLAAIVVAHVSTTPATVHPATRGTNLIGTNWTLVAMRDSAGKDQPVVTTATLQFDGTTMAGNDGCNGFGAQATVSGDHVLIGEGKGTLIGCVNREPGFAREVTLIGTVLEHGPIDWSITGNTLTITNPGVGTLTYRASTPLVITQPKQLIGKWSLATNTSPAGTSTNPARPAYLVFALSTFSGNDGCNAISGVATVTNGRMDFGAVTTTAIGCLAADVNGESSAIDALLGRNVTWSIQNDRLTLTKDGAGSLVYQRADIDAGFTGKSGAPSNHPSATSTK
jgi:heat shock protein HslJ